MGSDPLYGSDGAQGYTPHLGMYNTSGMDHRWTLTINKSLGPLPPLQYEGIVTCFKNLRDWALLGALYSPQVDYVNVGLTTYSYHPEALTWAAAEATCQAQAMQIQAQRTGSMPLGGPHAVGHLASAATNEDYEILLSIMSKQPPVFTSPGYGVNADFYVKLISVSDGSYVWGTC